MSQVNAEACPICERIARRDASAESSFVAELAECFVVLGDDQAYPGYCVLALKEHHEQLPELPLPRQLRLWEDVATVAAALTRELQPLRLNYECLGNLVPHIHWHVVPRYADDSRRYEPIWVRPPDERRGSMPAAQRAELIARLRRALEPGRSG